jgi:hypothetical protein
LASFQARTRRLSLDFNAKTQRRKVDEAATKSFWTAAGIPQSGSHAALEARSAVEKRCRRCPPSAVLLRPSSAVALLRRMERTGAPVFAALRPGKLPPQSKILANYNSIKLRFATAPRSATLVRVRISKRLHADAELDWERSDGETDD